jgi:hypothetical protein
VRLLGVLVGTDTVTAQGHSPWTRHARSGDFYLAKTGDPLLATSGDFFMATDSIVASFGNLGDLPTAQRHFRCSRVTTLLPPERAGNLARLHKTPTKAYHRYPAIAAVSQTTR